MGNPRFAKKVKAEPRPPSEDDLFLEELRGECAKAMIQWIGATIDVKRSLKSLTLSEFKGMAEACTSRWIVVVSQRLAESKLSPAKASEYRTLLLGG